MEPTQDGPSQTPAPLQTGGLIPPPEVIAAELARLEGGIRNLRSLLRLSVKHHLTAPPKVGGPAAQ